MTAQPTAIKIPIDRKYAPLPMNAEQGRMPDGMNGLSIDDGLFGAHGVSSRLYDFFKEQNQNISRFMIGANIRDRPQSFPSRVPRARRRHRRTHLVSSLHDNSQKQPVRR